MNVHSVVDTYTSLGRLGRDQGLHSDTEGTGFSRDRVDSSKQQPIQPLPFEYRNQTALETADITTVSEAASLTGTVSGQIEMDGQNQLEFNLLHNLSQVRLIPSRYV
jgi:hypothetical protein